MEIEDNKNINFLDLTITNNGNDLKYKIYRKHTCTDTVIHAKSFHPPAQKIAAFNSFIDRLLCVPLNN